MTFTVRVVERAEFDAWIADASTEGAASIATERPASPAAPAGEPRHAGLWRG